jgi:hypothetical protein
MKSGRILAALPVLPSWRMDELEHQDRCLSDSADWRSVIDLIFPHPSAPRVLLLAEGEGVGLEPSAQVELGDSMPYSNPT